MSDGFLTDGTEIKKPLPIYSGAADDLYQQLSNSDSLDKLILKIQEGANFIQTQYCFDLDIIKQYSDQLNEHEIFKDCKVLIGMGPLKSAKQADWMRKNLWGVNISDDILYKLESSDNPEKIGEQICLELIEHIMDLPCIDGAHLMGHNCEQVHGRIIASFRSTYSH
mgnify:FL=1